MANDIPLFQRQELPPTQVGAAKPSFSLADQSGLIRAGEAVERIGASTFDKLVKTRAANEEAEFHGLVNTSIEGYRTFVAANPNASFEDLQKQQQKVMSDIKKASIKATTGIAKGNNARWMQLNEEPINAKMRTSMEAIVSKQEFARASSRIELLRANEDIDSLKTFRKQQVQAGTFDAEISAAEHELEVMAINDAKDKRAATADKEAKELIEEQLKTSIELQAFNVAKTEGYEAAEEMLRDPNTTAVLLEAGMKREDIKSLLTDVSERVKHEKANFEEKLEVQRETDRGNVYDAIHTGEAKLPDGTTTSDLRTYIEGTALDEDEQEQLWQKSIEETNRRLSGTDIITNSQQRSLFYREIPLMLSGAVSRDELLNRVHNTRFGEFKEGEYIEPTLSEPHYNTLIGAINAQYEEGYGRMMGKVDDYAEGILLKTDSLGFVKNAPVRYQSFGDFQEAWLTWVASKGDTLKISEIYPEGRKLAATFQISDQEAFDREEVIDKELKAREQKKPTTKKLTPKIARRYLDIAGNDVDEAKRLAAEDGYKE